MNGKHFENRSEDTTRSSLIVGLQRIALEMTRGADQRRIIQFVVTDVGLDMFAVINSNPGEGGHNLIEGRHPAPDASVYLTGTDIGDIISFDCVRGLVRTTGNERCRAIFRERFMVVSEEGKRSIEKAAATQRGKRNVECVSVGGLSTSAFMWEYAVPGRPVKITGAMQNWQKSDWTIPRILREVANLKGMVRTGDYVSKYGSMDQIQSVDLGEYVRSCMDDRSVSDSSAVPPYAASNVVPARWTWLDYPPFVPRELCTVVKFWLGPRGTITPLHRDWSDNFLTQLVGSKRLVLFSPDHAALFSPVAVHRVLDSCSWLDPHNAGDAIMKRSSPMNVNLDPGDMLFLPAGWFHDVRAMTFSFSINFFLMRVPYANCPPNSL